MIYALTRNPVDLVFSAVCVVAIAVAWRSTLRARRDRRHDDGVEELAREDRAREHGRQVRAWRRSRAMDRELRAITAAPRHFHRP